MEMEIECFGVNFEEAKRYLTNVSLHDDSVSSLRILQSSEIEEILQSVDKVSSEWSLQKIQIIFALTMSTILNLSDEFGKLLSFRLIFKLQNLEGASSVGCCQPYVLMLIGWSLNKFMVSYVFKSGRDGARLSKCMELFVSEFFQNQKFTEYLQSSEELEVFIQSVLYFLFHFMTLKREELVQHITSWLIDIFHHSPTIALTINSCCLHILSHKFEPNDSFQANTKGLRDFCSIITDVYKRIASRNISFLTVDTEEIMDNISLKVDPKIIVITGFLQRVLMMVIEKHAHKSVSMDLAIDIMQSSIDNLYSQYGFDVFVKFISYFLNFIQKLSKSNKVQSRAGALEFIQRFLLTFPALPNVPYGSIDTILATSLDMIFARLHDSNQIVRCRSILVLCQFLEHIDDLEEIFFGLFISNLRKFLHRLFFSDMILFITSGERPQFRAKSLLLYTLLLPIVTTGYEDLEIFYAAANDKSPIVRRQVVASLFDIFDTDQKSLILPHLVTLVLPMIMDPCPSVSDKVSEVLFLVLIDGFSGSEEQQRISCDFINQAEELGLFVLLKTLFDQFTKKTYFDLATSKNRNKLCTIIKNCLFKCSSIESTSFNPDRLVKGAWIFLELLLGLITPLNYSEFDDIKRKISQFIASVLTNISDVSHPSFPRVLSLLHSNFQFLDHDQRLLLKSVLISAVSTITFPVSLISLVIGSLYELSILDNAYSFDDFEWAYRLLSSERFKHISANSLNDEILIFLAVVGSLALAGFKKDDPEVIFFNGNLHQSSFYYYDPAKSFFHFLFPSSTLKQIVLILDSFTVDSKCRASAILTLGKFCLRSQKLSREYISYFIQFLEIATPETILVNTLHSISDLAVRHTHIIANHMNDIVRCAFHHSSKVRRTAFFLVSNLILQDYIKWKSDWFFDFLKLLVDEDLELANLAKKLLLSTLPQKFPDLLRNNFSSMFLALNGCIDESGPTAFTSEKLDSNATLDRSIRFKIFSVVVNEFTEEQRLDVTAKLVNDILVPAVDNNGQLLTDFSKTLSVNYQTPFETTVEDVLLFLKSEALQIGCNSGNENSEFEDGETGSSTLSEARSKILKSLSKQQVINQILPVVISLKGILEKYKSPLQKFAMEYLVYLFKVNRNEVEMALQYDPILRSELEFDLKQYRKTNCKHAENGNKANYLSPYLDKVMKSGSVKKPLLKSPKSHLKSLSGRKASLDFPEANPKRRSWGVSVQNLEEGVEETPVITSKKRNFTDFLHE